MQIDTDWNYCKIFSESKEEDKLLLELYKSINNKSKDIIYEVKNDNDILCDSITIITYQ